MENKKELESFKLAFYKLKQEYGKKIEEGFNIISHIKFEDHRSPENMTIFRKYFHMLISMSNYFKSYRDGSFLSHRLFHECIEAIILNAEKIDTSGNTDIKLKFYGTFIFIAYCQMLFLIFTRDELKEIKDKCMSKDDRAYKIMAKNIDRLIFFTIPEFIENSIKNNNIKFDNRIIYLVFKTMNIEYILENGYLKISKVNTVFESVTQTTEKTDFPYEYRY